MSELLFQDLDESAYFLPVEQTRKRYTSEQVKGIEFKRAAVLLALGHGAPVEIVAKELGMNLRTVAAIASQGAAKVAGFRKQYADRLLAVGADNLALAQTKKHEASYLQLVTGFGIATDKAVLLAGMGEMGEEKIVKEEENHALVLSELRRIMSEPATNPVRSATNPVRSATNPAADQAPTDAQSGDEALKDKQLEQGVAGSEAGPGQDQVPADPGEAPGAGGGSGGPGPVRSPMGPGFVDLPAKG